MKYVWYIKKSPEFRGIFLHKNTENYWKIVWKNVQLESAEFLVILLNFYKMEGKKEWVMQHKA